VQAGAVFVDHAALLVERPLSDHTLELATGSAMGLRRLAAAGFPLIVVSCQSAVAMGRTDEQVLTRVGQRLAAMLAEIGVPLSGFWYCPHHPDGQVARYAVECGCRRPRPGLLVAARDHHRVELTASWVIGATIDDVEAGNRVACRTVFVDCGREDGWRGGPYRLPTAIASDLLEAATLILGARSRELAV
jgi:histidinol-phosphate phosphatase family protein